VARMVRVADRRSSLLTSLLVGLATACVVVSGCGASGSQSAAVETLLRDFSLLQLQAEPINVGRLPQPEGGKPVESVVAYWRLGRARDVIDVQFGLADLNSSGELGVATTAALCTGMAQLAVKTIGQGAPNWDAFLFGQIRVQLPEVSQDRVLDEVAKLVSIWRIRYVTPRLARNVYYPGCVGG
jgi:hypothetical protein